jgi:hypothetical protein
MRRTWGKDLRTPEETASGENESREVETSEARIPEVNIDRPSLRTRGA